jgi:hypothetical protein
MRGALSIECTWLCCTAVVLLLAGELSRGTSQGDTSGDARGRARLMHGVLTVVVFC